MRLLVGAGTPRGFLPALSGQLVLLTTTGGAAAFILVVVTDPTAAILVLSLQPEPHGGS